MEERPPYSYDDLPMDWVGNWSGRRRALSPERRAVTDTATGRTWTFRELDERANRVGSWLTETAGVEAGEAVCFIARNRIEPVDLYLACGKTGIVLAPLSFRLTKRELDELIHRIQPRVLFYEPAFADLAESLELPPCVADTVVLDDDGGRYNEEVLASDARDANRPLALNAPFLYVHTGGTTATPKVCIVSHRQMVWNSVELVLAAPEGLAGRNELLLFPLFHIGGWNTFTPIFHAGGRVVLMRQFDPSEALRIIADEGVNHMGAVEAMLKFIQDAPEFEQADLGSLQAITTAGAPCSEATMRPFWERGIAVAQSYGLTEAGPSNFIHGRLGASMEELQAHHESIGTAFFHTDYRIVDPVTHEPVPPGQPGVLLMRSPHNFDGYLKQPERTANTLMNDGWVWSGDLAREDEQGYVYIVGRADNMFVSGGENVSPEEIEEVLAQHPAVSQAAVFGIDDDRWGQVPMAVIVARGQPPAVEPLKEWLSERLARYKVPKRIGFADELPLTGAGKIDRNAARERYHGAA